MIDAIMLRRFRAESPGMIPGDLYRWALAVIFGNMSATERVEFRDRLLREAGDLAGGTVWNRMGRIREAMRDHRSAGPVGDLVHEASTLTPDRWPIGERQLLRILRDTDAQEAR